MVTTKSTFAEVQKRIREAEKQLEEDRQLAASMREEELKGFVEDWLSKAASLGFSVVEVVEAIKPHFPTGKAKRGAARKARADSGKKAEPKYRDPKSGQTWTGRGRPAGWMKAYLDAGKKSSFFGRQPARPTPDHPDETRQFQGAGSPVLRRRQIRHRAHPNLPAPVPPRDFDGMFRPPVCPLHIRRICRIESRLVRIPPVPQVRAVVPPVLAVENDQDRYIVLFGQFEEAGKRFRDFVRRTVEVREREGEAETPPGSGRSVHCLDRFIEQCVGDGLRPVLVVHARRAVQKDGLTERLVRLHGGGGHEPGQRHDPYEEDSA